MAANRVNMTSVGVWRRDCVTLNMFSAAKKGRERRKNARVVRISTMSARDTLCGTGRMGTPSMLGAAVMDL